MTRIEFAPAVTSGLDRTIDYLFQHDIRDAASRIQNIIRAIGVFEHNPLIDRQARGYLALHVYVTEIDTAFVLALRSQTEAGCTPP